MGKEGTLRSRRMRVAISREGIRSAEKAVGVRSAEIEARGGWAAGRCA